LEMRGDEDEPALADMGGTHAPFTSGLVTAH
jgi:hypothetical protein